MGFLGVIFASINLFKFFSALLILVLFAFGASGFVSWAQSKWSFFQTTAFVNIIFIVISLGGAWGLAKVSTNGSTTAVVKV